MTENTQTVTVADAWAGRLWEAGALWRGSSSVTSVTVNTLGFSVVTPTGAFIDYADDLLDYTPHTPAPSPADPRDAEIARLRAERDALKQVRHIMTTFNSKEARNEGDGLEYLILMRRTLDYINEALKSHEPGA